MNDYDEDQKWARSRMSDSAPSRLAGELECCGQTVLLYEDGDRQDDGSIWWSGCAMGDCPVCDQTYADWWEGLFKIGEPSAGDSEP